jgi:hypothetical protein
MPITVTTEQIRISKMPPDKFTKILVGVDGSEHAMNAVIYALIRARKDGAQPIAPTVAPFPAVFDLTPSSIEHLNLRPGICRGGRGTKAQK